MEKKKTGKAKIKPVVKPYLTGSPIDSTVFRAAGMFFFGMIMMAIAELLLSAALMWDNLALRIAINTMMLGVICMLFFQSGASRGTVAVNQGEILYKRREDGRDFTAREEAQCFHPMKGYVIGLLGALPLILCAAVLAATAQRQMTAVGALPGWLETLERRQEIGGALAYYHEVVPFGLTDALRMIVRITLMPFVNMVGMESPDALLTLERLSPLPMLLFPMAYGIGYQQGVRVRSRVHTDIAVSKRKRARREKKKQQARAARTMKGPEQLN